MFKNIQNRLLLTNPLLWNLKIVPFTVLAVAFHLIFFALGYASGVIDFTETENYYTRNFDNEIIIFIGILISIIIFIVWLVVYCRNNAFKSFYPKKNNSLFKEWLCILLFCILNVSYSATFLYAVDLKARNYFSEDEINKRCEIIVMSSLFLEGSFKEESFIWILKDSLSGSKERIRVERDSFEYDKKIYSLKSLINKNIDNFSVFSREKDSLNELKIKSWLTENKKDSVQWLFNEYFKILNQHNLKSNITPNKWLELTYTAPDFTNYVMIGKIEREKRYESGYDYYEGVDEEIIEETVVEPLEEEAFDSISKTLKIINGSEYIYSKYYVSHNALLRSYGKISKSWENPTVDLEFLLFFFYLASGLSLLVFSFKVTSGRNWIIAVVSLGIVGIVAGIISAIMHYKYAFPIIYMLVFIAVFLYFIIISKSKTSKGISGITLNHLLWLIPSLFPTIYFNALSIAKDVSGYYRRYDENSIQIEKFPKIDWLDENSLYFMAFNLVIVIVLMYIFSIQIKKWKGIPEA